MTTSAIRKKFIAFFEKQNHQLIPSASLVPDNDPSVLFTTAGMQQFKQYFLGQREPQAGLGARRAVSIQRCFRTSDIDQVGDASHHTFFEMFGNFSFGDYSKDDAIRFAWECLTKTYRLQPNRLWATVFGGDDRSVKDFESVKLWQRHLPNERIHELGRKDNWWGPPGSSGPCGPCTEIHVDLRGQACDRGQLCQPGCACGRFLEIWNLVFMEFFQSEDGQFQPLPQKNVDTGMGLERLASLLQKKPSAYETDLFANVIKVIEAEPGFGDRDESSERQRRIRIIADHLRGAVFLIADGVRFLNKEQGYILRRVFRRALDQFVHPLTSYRSVVEAIIDQYADWHPQLTAERKTIFSVLEAEAQSYDQTVKQSLQRAAGLRRKTSVDGDDSMALTPEAAFELYATHGLSLDRLRREGFRFDETAVQKRLTDHREKSRAGATGKFGGHGLGYALDASGYSEDDVERVTRLHTATHLLHQSLRAVLGDHVRQNGSDITPERLRFDFSHPEKMSVDQRQAVEDLVNEQIKNKLPVTRTLMKLDQALQSGALSFFREKYPPEVTVYAVGDFSREICGGPHVQNSGEIGHFRIISEKSSAAGIRRIKAVVDDAG